MTDCDVSLHGKSQSQPDPGVADGVRERAPELHAVALVRRAMFDGRVMVQRHCEREHEIEKIKDMVRDSLWPVKNEEDVIKDQGQDKVKDLVKNTSESRTR